MEDPEAKLAIEKRVAGRNFYKIVARNANAVNFIVVISCEIAYVHLVRYYGMCGFYGSIVVAI